MSSWTPCLIIALLSIFAVIQVDAELNFSKSKLSGILQWKPQKRPFCNAFTGCGRKRTPYPPFALSSKRAEAEDRAAAAAAAAAAAYAYNNEAMDEGLSDLIDINAEPAVENVQKQIMSQAKIFEAIKEASKEIFRQRNKQKLLKQQRKEQEEFLQQNGRQMNEQTQQMPTQQQQQLDKVVDDEMV